jgi:hypothetical protein
VQKNCRFALFSSIVCSNGKIGGQWSGSQEIILNEMFKSSTYFENLSKADKRKFTQKSFIENIKTNLFMKGNFKDRNAWVNKIQLTQPVIIGFKNIVIC